jgi:hypothetical protein
LLSAFLTLGTAKVALAAPPAANLDQLRNEAFDTPLSPAAWVNGNVGQETGHYVEGYSIAYRARLTDLPVGDTIRLILGYDIKHSDKHAIDYLTYYDRINDPLHSLVFGHPPEVINPLIGVAGVSATTTTFPIEAPSVNVLVDADAGGPNPAQLMPLFSFNNLSGAEKVMTLFGGTILDVQYDTSGTLAEGDLSASQSEARVEVTLIADGSTAVLAWGGHIGSRVEWGLPGDPQSAGGISGSPYHMRLLDWNLNNLGNQDRSLSAVAVFVPPPVCSLAVDSQVRCEGGDSACFTVSVTGGTTPYSYSWTGPNGFSANTATICINNPQEVNEGTYTVIVTDADDKADTCHATLIVDPLPDLTCSGDTLTCDSTFASARVTVNNLGDLGSVTYVWSPAPSSGQNTNHARYNTPGTKKVVVTSAAGCVDSCEAVITLDAVKPDIACSGDTLTCDSTNASTHVDVNNAGAIGHPVSYAWSGAGLVSGGSTADARWSAAGTKTVIVTVPATGCADTCSTEIILDATLPDLTCSGDTLTCDSTNASTHVTVNNPGDLGTLSYLWSGAGLVSGGSTTDARWSAAGTKKVVVTDLSTGCKDSCFAVITLDAVKPDIACSGDTLTCDSTNASTHVDVNNAGAIGHSVSYAWSGAGLVSGGSTADARWSAAGTKTVIVTVPATGCADTCQTQIILDAVKPDIACSGDTLTCDSTNASTHVDVNNAGAIGHSVSYAWSGAGLVSGGSTADARWSAAGTKTVIVTVPATGCADTCSTEIILDATLPDLTCSGDTLTCDSTNASTHVTVNNPGDLGTLSYLWSGAGLVSGGSTTDARWSAAGTKKVVVTDLSTGCKDSCFAVITLDAVKPDIACSGDTLTCDSTNASTHVDVNNAGAIGHSVSYAWSGAGLVSGGSTADARWSAAGTKTVIVTVPATGCADTCQTQIILDAVKPDIACSGDTLTCDSTNASTHVDVNNAGAIGHSVSYAWSGAGLVSGGSTADARWSAAGTKTVIVTVPATGCADTCSTEIIADTDRPVCSVSPADTTVCAGEQATFCIIPSGGKPPYAYSWSGPNAFASSDSCITVSDSGLYTVIVTGANGCKDTCEARLRTEVCGEEFCALTQGYYGNPGGIYCGTGQGTLALIQSLLCPSSDLVVGKPGRSLTIQCAAASCIITRLPAGGTTTTLPATLGDAVLNPSTCQTSPTLLPLNIKGRFLNVLLGQTIALSLNVRLDTDLLSFELCNQFTTQKALPGPDGFCGTEDDVKDPGLDGILGTLDDPIATFTIPQSVLTALSNLGLPNTVAGLLELANRALAGQATGGASLPDINWAVDAINRGFDKCRFLISCTNALTARTSSFGATAASDEFSPIAEEAGASPALPKDFSIGQPYPNPFNATVTIRYALPQDGKVAITVYNILGRKVNTLLDEYKPAGYHTLVWDGKDSQGNSVASGVYFYRVVFGKQFLSNKMTLLK